MLYFFQHQNQVRVFQDFRCTVKTFLPCLEPQALKLLVSFLIVSEWCHVYIILFLFAANEKVLGSGTTQGKCYDQGMGIHPCPVSGWCIGKQTIGIWHTFMLDYSIVLHWTSLLDVPHRVRAQSPPLWNHLVMLHSVMHNEGCTLVYNVMLTR